MDSEKSHAGAIAGVVVGDVAAIVLAAVAGYACHRRKYNIVEPRPAQRLADSPPSKKNMKKSYSL